MDPPDIYSLKKAKFIKLFTESHDVFDVDFKMKLEEFKKELDIWLKGSMEKVYMGSDADDFYTKELEPIIGQCIHIVNKVKSGGNYATTEILALTKVEEIYLNYTQAVVHDISRGLHAKDGHWKHGLLDSLIV